MGMPRSLATPLLRLPILALVAATRLRWGLNALAERLRGRPPTAAPPRHQHHLRGGFWFRQSPCDPFSSYYFTPPERRQLADLLRRSDGRETLLSSHHLPAGWLLRTWCGLVVLGASRSVCEQTSCGSGARLAVTPYPHRLSDCFVALQRNDQNYAHFLCEVACSLLAFEEHLQDCRRLAIGARFGGTILQLAGFRQSVIVVPSQSLIRVHNVEVFSMLPGGYVHGALLQALGQRVTTALDCAAGAGAEVVFLNRARTEHRQLVNGPELLEAARRRFPDLDVVVASELPFAEQVRRLSQARVVIAPQGAHAANLIWSRRLEHYVEISANGDGYVAAMAAAIGATVHRCISRPLGVDPADPDYDRLLFADHRAELGRFEAILQGL